MPILSPAAAHFGFADNFLCSLCLPLPPKSTMPILIARIRRSRKRVRNAG